MSEKEIKLLLRVFCFFFLLIKTSACLINKPNKQEKEKICLSAPRESLAQAPKLTFSSSALTTNRLCCAVLTVWLAGQRKRRLHCTRRLALKCVDGVSQEISRITWSRAIRRSGLPSEIAGTGELCQLFHRKRAKNKKAAPVDELALERDDSH